MSSNVRWKQPKLSWSRCRLSWKCVAAPSSRPAWWDRVKRKNVWLYAESRIVWKERMYDCMHESIKLSTLVASSNFLLVHFGISQFSAPVFLSRKEEGRASCVCHVMQKSKSAFKGGQHHCKNDKSSKMISRQKQNKHSICEKGNRRIQQVVLRDVRVLDEVASLRCFSCASSFCLNILLRLDMTHADLSPSPATSLSLMPAQGALYFRCTGHQIFWDKVVRSAQEAACEPVTGTGDWTLLNTLSETFLMMCRSTSAISLLVWMQFPPNYRITLTYAT